jgi:hypothetical protein
MFVLALFVLLKSNSRRPIGDGCGKAAKKEATRIRWPDLRR